MTLKLVISKEWSYNEIKDKNEHKFHKLMQRHYQIVNSKNDERVGAKIPRWIRNYKETVA